MVRRRLPIGMQTFRELREDGCYYVDKTHYIRTLLDGPKHYFLSRPRRFGKSLFLDTLKELFEGRGELFEGLAIHEGGWDWSARRPVARLDFSKGDFTAPGYLHRNAMAQLDGLERRAGVACGYDTAPERLSQLLETLHERTGERAVVLVDEYDKPILDALEDPALARANRNYLRGLYSTLKFADAHVRFSFITGVSKFSKVSLFSGLNNLRDITLDSRYSGICGYTEGDLDAVFAPELPGLDRGAIREWYNGYSWLGGERVYNPFDILLLFDSREFKAHWLETGTPTFLVDALFRRRVRSVDFDGMLASDELLSAFDVDEIAPEALLFQTGYLTIREREDLGGERLYRLGYPNREVRQGLNRSLLRRLGQDGSRQTANGVKLRRLLEADDVAGLRDLFHAFYAGIPRRIDRFPVMVAPLTRPGARPESAPVVRVSAPLCDHSREYSAPAAGLAGAVASASAVASLGRPTASAPAGAGAFVGADTPPGGGAAALLPGGLPLCSRRAGGSAAVSKITPSASASRIRAA